MDNKPNQNWLIVAIVFAAISISGSIIFYGFQLGRQAGEFDSDLLSKRIDQGIKKFITEQAENQRRNQADRQENAAKKAKTIRPVTASRDHIYGNPQATVSLIEYSEFECIFCKRFHPVPPKIVEAYNGQVNWVIRHFPLEIHNPVAQREAEAAECVAELGGDKAFFEYADLIFELTQSNGRGIKSQSLSSLAVQIGLNKKDFDNCLASGNFTDRVISDYNEGLALGISGTPTVVILNNRTRAVRYKQGALPIEAFKKDIDNLLSKGNSKP